MVVEQCCFFTDYYQFLFTSQSTMNQNKQSAQFKKLYDALFIKFDWHSLQLLEAVHHLSQSRSVKAELQPYHIELSEVLKNIEIYLKEIRTYFETKLPKSIKAVQLIVDTLRKKCTRSTLRDELCPTKKAAAVLSLQTSLQSLSQFLQSAWAYEDDIASFPKLDSPIYVQTYKHITIMEDLNPEQSHQQDIVLRKMINIGSAAVLTELAQSNSLFGRISFGLSFPRYILDYDSAVLRNTAFQRTPTVEALSEIWNIAQRGAIGKLKYINFQWVNTSIMLYIPRGEQLAYNLTQQEDDTVPVRLIYDGTVRFWGQGGSCGTCSQSFARDQPEINQIIIHFHGGGFISQSSCTSQSYTRRWAKDLKIPVLSVDYSMPPNSRFPAAVQDVLAVYKFVTRRLSLICNIKPKKIILAGDSAGGNLTCSLMGMIIKEGLQQPSAIFLAYPAPCLRLSFSPSRLHSFFTPILNPSLLYLCLTEYLGPDFCNVQENPLASPLFLTKHFVGEQQGDTSFPSQWPKTRIFVGDHDPLFDDSLRLCQKMAEAGIDVNCRVYKNMSHGFLGMDKILARGEDAVVDSIAILKEFLEEKSEL